MTPCCDHCGTTICPCCGAHEEADECACKIVTAYDRGDPSVGIAGAWGLWCETHARGVSKLG